MCSLGDYREADQDQMPDHEDPSLSQQRGQQFKTLFEEQYSAVYAFALRRLYGSREDASDVTAEVFTTAWRRVDQLPAPPEDRLWIFGVARRVVFRHERSAMRRFRLIGRLRAEASVDLNLTDGVEGVLTDRLRVQAAMARLSPSDRDVLSLVLWEQLSHSEASNVLGCSVNAVALRLLKAKRRLREELERDQEQSARHFGDSSGAGEKEVYDGS
jgi:RNA polymerase sigma factor (sigma-70 family)